MINFNLRVRRAVAQDLRQIAVLNFYEANTHRHLDWRSAQDWVGSQNYWVIEEDGQITGALACPEDPPNVAWIRLFAYRPHLSGPDAWSALWEKACPEIILKNRQAQVAAIVVKQWFQTILLSSGFSVRQDIVILQLSGENIRTFHGPPRMRIRRMQESDLNEIVNIDLAAFGLFWHNTLDSIQRARSQAVLATVAEDDSGVIGYQISTGNPFGAHLARLGVRPEAQGKGVGASLVSDLVQQLNIAQSGRLSVNTQADNASSLALYNKLGFQRTGEHFPVLTYPPGVL